VPVLALLRPMGAPPKQQGLQGRLQHRGRAGDSASELSSGKGQAQEAEQGSRVKGPAAGEVQGSVGVLGSPRLSSPVGACWVVRPAKEGGAIRN